jgi:hypothetical protein
MDYQGNLVGMGRFKLRTEWDNPGLSHVLDMMNLYAKFHPDGTVEFHAFGGPRAQELYEACVREKGADSYTDLQRNQSCQESPKVPSCPPESPTNS